MADLPVNQNWEVEVPNEVELKWMEVRIQEYRSRLAKTKQMIEDLIKGQVVKLEADVKMLELSLIEMEKKRNAVTLTNNKE